MRWKKSARSKKPPVKANSSGTLSSPGAAAPPAGRGGTGGAAGGGTTGARRPKSRHSTAGRPCSWRRLPSRWPCRRRSGRARRRPRPAGQAEEPDPPRGCTGGRRGGGGGGGAGTGLDAVELDVRALGRRFQLHQQARHVQAGRHRLAQPDHGLVVLGVAVAGALQASRRRTRRCHAWPGPAVSCVAEASGLRALGGEDQEPEAEHDGHWDHHRKDLLVAVAGASRPTSEGCGGRVVALAGRIGGIGGERDRHVEGIVISTAVGRGARRRARGERHPRRTGPAGPSRRGSRPRRDEGCAGAPWSRPPWTASRRNRRA